MPTIYKCEENTWIFTQKMIAKSAPPSYTHTRALWEKGSIFMFVWENNPTRAEQKKGTEWARVKRRKQFSAHTVPYIILIQITLCALTHNFTWTPILWIYETRDISPREQRQSNRAPHTEKWKSNTAIIIRKVSSSIGGLVEQRFSFTVSLLNGWMCALMIWYDTPNHRKYYDGTLSTIQTQKTFIFCCSSLGSILTAIFCIESIKRREMIEKRPFFSCPFQKVREIYLMWMANGWSRQKSWLVHQMRPQNDINSKHNTLAIHLRSAIDALCSMLPLALFFQSP